MNNTISDANLANWLEAAGRYFENRDTGGEDMAHWSNVFSAENCREAANRIRLSAQQRVPVVRVKELEWEDADEGMCTKWRACALGGHYELVALDGDGGGLAVNFYWGRPLSFWFIQGEPDEWGPTGPKMFPTLDAAKSAAQADYEQRIMASIEIIPAGAGDGRLQQWVVGPDLPAGTIKAVRAALMDNRESQCPSRP